MTDDPELDRKLRLLRNHGLSDRDTCEVFAYNSRLDTVQAVVADHLLNRIEHITASRIANARALDEALAGIPGVTIPPRDADHVKQVYHIYSLRFERRDALQKHLIEHGVDAKVHYPKPMHLQPAARAFGYFRKGDFPMAEAIADSTLSLPVHEFIGAKDRETIAAAVRKFYA